MEPNETKAKALDKIRNTIEVCLLICGFRWEVINNINNKVSALFNGALADHETGLKQ